MSGIENDIVAELRRFGAHWVVWRDDAGKQQLHGVKATKAADGSTTTRGHPEPPVLTMSALGQLGRFGNQVFQYAFLRICAKASGATIQCAPWVGQSLFGHSDPSVSVSLEPLIETGPNADALLEIVPEFIPYIEKLSGKKAQRIGIEAISEGSDPGDLLGFFQWHTSAYRPHKEFFRSLFEPTENISAWADETMAALRRRGKTVVAIQLRVGDYKWLPQFAWTLMIPPQWWVEWLDSIWDQLDDPVLYLCSDDVAAVRHCFNKYQPITSDDLVTKLPETLRKSDAGFYPDFLVMTRADVLGISNSTFGFSAALLNRQARLFVRPHWDFKTRFTTFEPWDADPLLSLPGSRRRIFKDYGEMLRLSRATKGTTGQIVDALVHHPVSAAALLRYRMGFAYRTGGLRAVGDVFLARIWRR